MGRGERRPAVHLRVRRDRARAAGRDASSAGRCWPRSIARTRTPRRVPWRCRRARPARATRAATDEGGAVAAMLDGGFVAPNEVEQKNARSVCGGGAAPRERGRTCSGTSLDVQRLRATRPFDGEIATRTFDPGAFVHPGAAIVSVVDREHGAGHGRRSGEGLRRARAVATVVRDRDARHRDVHVAAPVSRRAPRADPRTRTIHFEVDVARSRAASIPVGDHRDRPASSVGKPVPATEMPLYAATQEEGKARFFVVEGGVAHAKAVPVIGESGGGLYFQPQALPAGTRRWSPKGARSCRTGTAGAGARRRGAARRRARSTGAQRSAAAATGGRCDRPLAPQPARELDARHRGDRLRLRW